MGIYTPLVSLLLCVWSQENYHNVFGYIEDIYNAHDQFWTWTLEPALETVRTLIPIQPHLSLSCYACTKCIVGMVAVLL